MGGSGGGGGWGGGGGVGGVGWGGVDCFAFLIDLAELHSSTPLSCLSS